MLLEKLLSGGVDAFRHSTEACELHDEGAEHPGRVIAGIVPTSDRSVDRTNQLIQVAEQRRVHVRVVKLELKKITFS
jgi:hypothetical protein